MSYAIIRNSNLKMSGLSASSRHNERKNKNYGNPNVDTTKSDQNYHLISPIENTYKKELERIVQKYGIQSKFRLNGSKQSNVACEFVVTSDPSFFEKLGTNKTKQFFKDALEFIKQKVGSPFILSAVVHMDEKTPHMHVTYLPTVEKKNSKGELARRLNCNDFWKGRDSYRNLQNSYYDFITKKGYALERGKLVETTNRQHIESNQLKINTLQNEIKELDQNIKMMYEEYMTIKEKLKGKKKTEIYKSQLDSIKVNLQRDGSISGISLKEIEELKALALTAFEYGQRLDDVSQKYISLKEKIPTEKERLNIAKKMALAENVQHELEEIKHFLKTQNIDYSHSKNKDHLEK